MGTHVEPQPAYGRRLVEQARRLDVSPASLIRHIRQGRKLSDGRRVHLAATVTPGGFRVTDAAIDEFFAAITADRLGRAEAPTPRSPTAARKAHEAAERELSAAGF